MRIVVAGASGYIGRHVVAELVGRGHDVVALMRDSPHRQADPALVGAERRVAAFDDAATLARTGFGAPHPDALVSCIASRSGRPADAWAVDYATNRLLLDAAQERDVAHFSLLSALCVQTPQLAFQRAKQAFENELACSGIGWSVVRPSAFFKSLAGQITRLKAGKPFLLFGRGDGPACLPISEADTARLLADTLTDPALCHRVLPVGGPGSPITPKERATLLFELLGKRARFRRIPLSLVNAVAAGLAAGSGWSQRIGDAAEFARIARFYATEPLLVPDPQTGRPSAAATPRYGQERLVDFYRNALTRGLDDQPLGEQALFDRRPTA